MREAERAPLLVDLFTWLAASLDRLPQKSHLAENIRYGIKRRAGPSRFIGGGSVEIDNNAVKRAMRPIALSRKDALLVGSDEGAVDWSVIVSLIETCKLNSVEPRSFLTDALTMTVQGWPTSRIEDPLPWTFIA